jgi:hypothetical protein
MKNARKVLILTLALLFFIAPGSFGAPQQIPLETTQNVRIRVPPAGRWVNDYSLTANTVRMITVPGWVNYVNISPSVSGSTIWVNWTSAITGVPSGDVTDGTGVVANSGVRYIGPIGDISPAPAVPAIQTFWVISGTSQEISVECWR